jgi:CRP-like cAMP-binding protein
MSLTGLFPIDKWNFKSESVLNNLPSEEFDQLCANMTEQKYQKGDVLFKEGAVPEGIFFIKKGKIKKFKVDHDKKEHIFYVANTGELIGYHAILSEERYPDSAAAIEESVIAFIPKEDFLETLQHSKILSQRLLKNLSHEFAVLTNSISVSAQRTVRERLAIMLIVLREKFKDETPEGKEITINISRSDLANMVGTAKENVVRFLKEFKVSGILNTHGRKIFINDVKKLIKISNSGSK